MKTINLTVACIMIATASFAQKSGVIGVTGGVSFPLGNISKSDYEDLSSGFAKTGSFWGINGTYFFSKHIGAGLDFSMTNYGLKDMEKIGNGAVEAYELDDGAEVTHSHWRTVNILPYFNYRVGKDKWSFDFKAMLGYSSVTSPKIDIALEDNNILQEEATAGAFAWGLGTAFNYEFAKHFGFSVNVNYLMTKPDIDITTTGVVNPVESLRIVDEYNEQIGMLNLGAGLFYRFGKE